MAQQYRGFAKSALQAIAVPRFWSGPQNIQVGYLDKTHYSKEGAEHMNKCVDKVQDELAASGVDKAESRSAPHPSAGVERRMTIYAKVKEVVVGVGHFYMNGTMSFKQEKPYTVEMPKDNNEPWIEKEAATEAAKSSGKGSDKKSGDGPKAAGA